MSTSPTAAEILSAIVNGAAAPMVAAMPLNTSSLSGVPAAGNSTDPPLTSIGSGVLYNLVCILQAAANVMEFAASEYGVDAINPNNNASTALVYTGLLETTDVGLEARPNGGQKLRITDLNSVKDISSRFRTRASVTPFYLAVINAAVVPSAASQTYLKTVAGTTLALIKSADPEMSPEGVKFATDTIQKMVSELGGCSVSVPASSTGASASAAVVADTKATQYGGKGFTKYAGGHYTDETGTSAYTVEDSSPVVSQWSSSRTHTFGGAGVLIEMVDRNKRAVSVTKADGSRVYGVQFNISPETLTVNSVQVINRFQTLASWVEEHWGSELDQISFSGKSFSFNVQLESRYLTVISRRDFSAYKELRDLMQLYQTNGLILQGPSVLDSTRQVREFYTPASQLPVRKILTHPRTGMVKERLYVRLTFQGFMQCMGYFESIEVTEDAQNPFQMSYSLNFKSEMTTYTVGRDPADSATDEYLSVSAPTVLSDNVTDYGSNIG